MKINNLEKFLAKAESRHIGKVCWVVVSWFRSEFLLEQFSHVIVVEVDCRHHDMAGLLPFQLYDALTEIGLHDFYSVLFEVRIHLTLLCKHRL